MLKITLSENENSIEFSGTGMDMIAESCTAVLSMYKAIRAKSELGSMLFKSTVMDDDFWNIGSVKLEAAE